MSVAELLSAVEAWPISAAMRGELPGTEWLFPIVETLHVMALAIVIGILGLLYVIEGK